MLANNIIEMISSSTLLHNLLKSRIRGNADDKIIHEIIEPQIWLSHFELIVFMLTSYNVFLILKILKLILNLHIKWHDNIE